MTLPRGIPRALPESFPVNSPRNFRAIAATALVFACLAIMILPSSTVILGSSLSLAGEPGSLAAPPLGGSTATTSAPHLPSTSAATWVDLSAGLSTSPAARAGASMVTDSEDNEVLLFGGCSAWSAGNNCAHPQGDTWTYADGAWTNITSTLTTSPSPRWYATVSDDPGDGYVVLFGGSNAAGTVAYNDTWTFHAGVWTNITATAGHAPSPRDGAAMAYDAKDGYVVLFGGGSPSGGLGDTWTFSGGKWAELSPATSPGVRCCAAFAYDASAQKLVLYGGGNHGSLGDTWTFSGGSWTVLTGSGPAARCCASFAPDVSLGGILLFGGNGAADTWNFTAGAWQSLSPSSAPPARSWLGMAWDPSDGYVLLFGGESAPGGTFYGDTWGWETQVVAPPKLSVSSFTATPSSVGTNQMTVLAASVTGGSSPYSYVYTGLPPGCTSSDAASLDCTPTTAGLYPIVVTVTDSASATAHAELNLSVANLAIAAFTADPSTVSRGSSTALDVSVSGGDPPYAYAYSGLPPGCTASSSPDLSCIPTSTGVYPIIVKVTDAASATAHAELNLTVTNPPRDTWTELTDLTTAPSPRTEAAMSTDSEDDEVVLFGGCSAWSAGNNCAHVQGDTWTFADGAWTNITSTLTVSPPARWDASMVDDPATGYLLLFGGDNGAGTLAYNDTWSFHAGVWTNLTATAGHAPSPRGGAAMVYDAADHEVVLYGGGSPSGDLADTWTFIGGKWTEISPATSPGTRCCSAVAYDAQVAEVVLFGGGDHGSLGDTWTFVGGTWTAVTGTAPSARCCAVLSGDAVQGGLLLFGGNSAADTWNFTGGSWVDLAPATSPAARSWQGMAWDPSDSNILMFGGESAPGGTIFGDSWTWGVGSGAPPKLSITSFSADPSSVDVGSPTVLTVAPTGGVGPYTYAYTGLPAGCASASTPELNCTPTAAGGYPVIVTVTDSTSATAHAELNLSVQALGLDTWINVTGSVVVAPSARYGAAMVTDSADGYILLFGGCGTYGLSTCSQMLGDTWIFQKGYWYNITANLATSPSPRWMAGIAYDAQDGYVVLYGGQNSAGQDLSDTWTFHAGVWTNISATAGSPPGRNGPAFAYDPADKYVVMFGGSDLSGGLDDTWTFSAGVWTQLSPTQSPSVRCCAMMAYDAADGYLVLFGGADHGSLGDTWTFVGGQWTQLSVSAPPARCCAAMAADPATGGVLLFGGNGLGDTWNFTSGGWVQLSPSNVPSVRSKEALAYDPASGNLVLFGGAGAYSGFPIGDTWEWGTSAGVQSADPGPQISSFTISAQTVVVGDSVTISVVVSGGIAPYHISYSGLPSGCKSADQTTLTCTPSAAGVGVWTIEVSVGDLAEVSSTSATTLRVDAAPQSNPTGVLSASELDLIVVAIVIVVLGVGLFLFQRSRRQPKAPRPEGSSNGANGGMNPYSDYRVAPRGPAPRPPPGNPPTPDPKTDPLHEMV